MGFGSLVNDVVHGTGAAVTAVIHAGESLADPVLAPARQLEQAGYGVADDIGTAAKGVSGGIAGLGQGLGALGQFLPILAVGALAVGGLILYKQVEG